MKKYIIEIVVFVVLCYLWFAILPEAIGWSFPTGGWDWLTYTAAVGSVFFAFRGIKLQLDANNKNVLKQQQLSVIPCLDVDAYTTFDAQSKNNSFRYIKEHKGNLLNDGYIIIRDKSKMVPQNFTSHINIKLKNRGLSTAFQVEVYLCELECVEGLEDLEKIEHTPIINFYNKVKYSNYEYYEGSGGPIKTDWLISPQYCLTNNNEDEFNLVFDTSNIQHKYHNILKVKFEDIYKNSYYQLIYLYFDNKKVAVHPISKVIEN